MVRNAHVKMFWCWAWPFFSIANVIRIAQFINIARMCVSVYVHFHYFRCEFYSIKLVELTATAEEKNADEKIWKSNKNINNDQATRINMFTYKRCCFVLFLSRHLVSLPLSSSLSHSHFLFQHWTSRNKLSTVSYGSYFYSPRCDVV